MRNKVAFAKKQKDVEKSAKELVKLAKEAKPITDAVKKAKDVAEPQKKWDDIHGRVDQVVRETSAKWPARPVPPIEDAKGAFGVVKKVCADCHKISASKRRSF